jgi:hypothetical protein
VGVYDIRNIKLKMINEGTYTPMEAEGKIYNSPWNIAVNFDVDMSFDPKEISTMLNDYETGCNTGMDITEISEEIHKYTSGYPFLVSRVCQYIDETLNRDWTAGGIQKAVNEILMERNTLFDDIYKNAESNNKLYNLLYDITIVGKEYTFNTGNPEIAMGIMYGLLAKRRKKVAISNAIFEILLSNYFISKNETSGDGAKITGVLQYDIVKDGKFDMELCLRKFAEHYAELFSEKDTEFLERHGRLVFLSYLKPLINGQGFYHIESQFTDLRRMDIIVDFGRDQFIVELKLWHGEKYKQEAYKQLLDYMNSKKAETGYLLTFDFRKNVNKQTQAEWAEIEGKKIFDVVV